MAFHICQGSMDHSVPEKRLISRERHAPTQLSDGGDGFNWRLKKPDAKNGHKLS
jgi:hypothetical protein